MPNWWDSIDAVNRFNIWMQISIVVFGILTVGATALTIVASKRISDLQGNEALELQKRLGAAEKTAQQVREQLNARENAEKELTEKLAAANVALEVANKQMQAEQEIKTLAEQ